MRDSSEAVKNSNDNKWNIPGRWEGITGLGKEAEMLLRIIAKEKPNGHISPRYLRTVPPKWSMSQLYREVLHTKMSHDDLRRAMAELHKKNILHLAFSYYAFYPRDNRLVGVYKDPRAFHKAIKQKEPTLDIDKSRIEIYLVLPEDDSMIA